MTRDIRRAGAAFVAGFFALTLGLVWWQVVRAGALNHQAGNPRVIEAATRAGRGAILAADGTVLAHTERLPGGQARRVYAMPSLAQTIGYISVRYGVTGLEEAMDDYLSGARGGDALHRIWSDISREPERGNDVVLTINPAIQAAAARALGDRPGAVVALDPRTGAVLALVSSPSFDPGAIDSAGPSLLEDAGRPLLNRATQGQYPPGSTFKTVTAAAALDSGVYRADATFRCPSGYLVGGFVIACKGIPAGVRDYDFAHAYAWSVNATFAEIAVKLTATTMVQYGRRFGFEESIPFDIPLATSKLLRPGHSFDDVLLANTGFGQGELSVTPMEMALVAAVVANGGDLPEPFLVRQVRAPGGRVLAERAPHAIRRVIRPEVAATLRGFMAAVIREGQAPAAAVPGVEVGGKTGTAETASGQPTHAWFIGIAPLENPTVAVAVIVENGGQGSVAAAPIAQAVFRAALGR